MNPTTRRDFLRLGAATAALVGMSSCALPAPPARTVRKPRPIAPGAKIRIAQIGCGGKGASDVRSCKDEHVVAIADMDWGYSKVQQVFAEFPNARKYFDFRKMLQEMDDEIDAVVVSVPDHMHFLPAYLAITMGKHVYVQKPITQTIGEARELLRMARLHGVCTQMGNQGHAGDGIRTVREWVQSGVVGPIREVEIWTNRPIWPQGMTAPAAPTPEYDGLNWELFLGRAPEQPYSKWIHPFKWRGWRDFGCGALGDMACHLMDASFWALDLGTPESVEAESVGLTPLAYPKSSTIVYRFPARGGMPPVKLTWRDGLTKPALPDDLKVDGETFKGKGGQLMFGEKATIYDDTDYCFKPRIVSKAKRAAIESALPPPTIPRVPKGSPYLDWFAAIRAITPRAAGSNSNTRCR